LEPKKTGYWRYELVEIPKSLLEKAAGGRLEMMHGSKQSPKPGYCHVTDETGRVMFQLYFDGGTERKLQIKKLDKSLCTVHAEWKFQRSE
jgi:type II restriction enzyme